MMKNLNETLAGMIDIHPVFISTTSSNNNNTVFSSPLYHYWNTLSQSTTNGLQTAYDWYYSGLFAHQKPENALLADIACHVFLSMAVFWSGALLYTFVDLTHWPAFIYRYKSRSSKYPITGRLLFKMAALVLTNQLTAQLLTALFAHFVYGWVGRDARPQVPPLSTIVYQVAVFIVLQDPIAYVIHREFHFNRKLYRKYHSVHHRWLTPIALSALYVHPVEYIANQVPILAGPLVMGCHRAVASIWMVLVQLMLLKVHSGYCFPGELWFAEFHEYHHVRPDKNLGNSGLIDYLFGTNGSFSDEVNNKKNNSNNRNKKLPKLKE